MNGDATNLVLWARSFVPAWVPLVYAAVLLYLIDFFVDVWGSEVFGIASALLLVGAVLVHLAWRRRRAELGSEALRIRWTFYDRTIRFADVRRATPEGKTGVAITTMSGQTLRLHTSDVDAAPPRDVLQRLWKALASGAEEGSRGAEREMLARSGRTLDEWRSALRELGSPGSYRRSTLSPDRLWAIAENPGIEPEVRAAALVALSASHTDDATRARFRRIAATTVDRSLSTLLDDLADDGDDEALVRLTAS